MISSDDAAKESNLPSRASPVWSGLWHQQLLAAVRVLAGMRAVNVVPTAISVAALFVALGGTGYALVSTKKSHEIIHACVSNRTGVVRIARGSQA
jgi:hypothetical protein